MPQKIYIIRHGETDYNFRKRAQGWLDIPLNQTGIDQAQKLANHLQSTKIDAAYTSDLKRSHQTARVITKALKLRLSKTKHLRERHLGVFQGKTWDEINLEHADLVQKFDDFTDLDWAGHKGESIRQVRGRIQKFLNLLHRKHQNKSVALFTHGGTQKVILSTLTTVDFTQRIRSYNTGLTVLEKSRNGSYEIITLNDISHLPPV